MAAGLNVCSASHCTGFFAIGSVKVDAGFGEITGFPLAGRVKGPITQDGKFCADNKDALNMKTSRANSAGGEYQPSGTKALTHLAALTARMKPCPNTNPSLLPILSLSLNHRIEA